MMVKLDFLNSTCATGIFVPLLYACTVLDYIGCGSDLPVAHDVQRGRENARRGKDSGRSGGDGTRGHRCRDSDARSGSGGRWKV